MIGFVVDLCRGTIQDVDSLDLWSNPDELAKLINAAPACGLCLEEVFYSEADDDDYDY
jgi:tRNA U38,U39,U40 pseudouridine synthase TruA